LCDLAQTAWVKELTIAESARAQGIANVIDRLFTSRFQAMVLGFCS
jgi:hypothetical protein